MSEETEKRGTEESEEKSIMQEIEKLEKRVKRLDLEDAPNRIGQRTPKVTKEQRTPKVTKENKEETRPKGKNNTLSLLKLKKELEAITKPHSQWLREKLVKSLKRDLKKGKSIDLSEKIGYLSPHWWKIPPKNEKALQRWKEKWGDALLVIGRKTGQFLFDLKDLLHQFPLSDDQGGMQLKHLQKIVEHLRKEELARWLNEEETTAIVFWQTREEIAEKIYQEAKQLGTPFIRFEDLQKIYGLPPQDLKKIIKFLEKEGEKRGNAIFFKT